MCGFGLHTLYPSDGAEPLGGYRILWNFFMAHWKKNIKRVFITAIWCAIAVGSVALLIAAMNRRSEQKCSGYEIEILGTEEQMFIDKKKVEEMVFGGQQFLNKNIAEYNLRAMERKLPRPKPMPSRRLIR